MRRPSIFSRDYKRKMRARRMKTVFLMVIVVLSGAAFLFRTSVSSWLNENIKTINVKNIHVKSILTGKEKQDSDNKNNVQEASTGQEQKPSQPEQAEQTKPEEKPVENADAKPEEEQEITEKYYEVKLSEGQVVKAIYEENEGKRSFRYVLGEDNPYFNISPSGDKVVIFDRKTQDMLILDSSGNVSDITRKQYVSSKGDESYSKDEQLKRTPGYVWHDSPKFINDEDIVYISQLPWFNKELKYIWKYNLNSRQHTNIYNSGAVNMSFDKPAERGLQINIDGSTRYILPGGEIVE